MLNARLWFKGLGPGDFSCITNLGRTAGYTCLWSMVVVARHISGVTYFQPSWRTALCCDSVCLCLLLTPPRAVSGTAARLPLGFLKQISVYRDLYAFSRYRRLRKHCDIFVRHCCSNEPSQLVSEPSEVSQVCERGREDGRKLW